MTQQDPLKTFGIILPAVAEMMDDLNLSTGQAMKALYGFLGEGEQPPEVQAAIARLNAIDDELEFRCMLGQESLRALMTKG